jgi:predicted SAM-dependent methyltransferase
MNFDVSPTLRLQRMPLLGALLRPMMRTKWPRNVRHGDIIKGLPRVQAGSCGGVYCSHVLEHLALEDCRKALRQSHRILANDGTFVLVVPDMGGLVQGYNEAVAKGDAEACIRLIRYTLMGHERRVRGLKGFVQSYFGNAHHLWMWDEAAMRHELLQAGFTQVRRIQFGETTDPMFRKVEEESRFKGALALEARK